MSWASFRELYEAEVLAGQRASTREKADAVFDVLEAEVAPQKLVNLNERTLSRFVAKLRAERTVQGAGAHHDPQLPRVFTCGAYVGQESADDVRGSALPEYQSPEEKAAAGQRERI
jgi:hypothetical protein